MLKITKGIIHFRAVGSLGTTGFARGKLMKRTRAAARIQQENNIDKDKNDEDTTAKTQAPVASEKPKLNFKSLRSRNTENAGDTTDRQVVASSKRSKGSQRAPKVATHVEGGKEAEELKPNAKPGKGKVRAVVDLEMMKAELSQLEDPPVTPWEKELSSGRLQYEFFDAPCKELAQRLLGKVLVRYLENGTVLKGRIVETEAYLGGVDRASQSYQNRVTPRNLPMYMPPGTVYVYMTYGMYHCFNISSQGDGAAVLLRAVDPLEGVECMADQRNSQKRGKTNTSKTKKPDLKLHELCNGPSKLCMAYQLDRQHNKYSVCTWKGMWIEDDGALEDFKIVKCPRIGIDSCGPEWAGKPLRYYVYGNKSVSKKNKKEEMELTAEA
ncbi:PREDICTED: DNA-3-methyladenine glycosylase-like isoform X2 [Vollenhovia emeryi]|uniref:DNA-3-methyladenine glycosylase-like isoform X2 n=1 Tax=Vollenhovia emeryi TaxID=411798 RepID=UPI0005F4F551|nr:PREDICTED: DNA-3-methyladenine glycosylase-like isoform X2 [Vollenhovia emeryi]